MFRVKSALSSARRIFLQSAKVSREIHSSRAVWNIFLSSSSECPAWYRLVIHLVCVVWLPTELWWRWWLKIITVAEPILPLLKIMTEPLSASAAQNEVLQFWLREIAIILWRISSTCLKAVLCWIQKRSEDQCTE